jgi:ABC-2 type transport system permease protein
MAVALVFEKKSKLYLQLRDSWLMIVRSTTHIFRQSDQLLGAFFQPIMFILLFSAVFGPSIEKALPPGIIVQTVAFGSTVTAISVCSDLKNGIVDRFRSLPMSSLAVLNGHVVSDLIRNSISIVVMLLVGLLIGFRAQASFVGWLEIAGILMLFTFAFSWLTFVIIFPLTFASSAFVPTSGMPKYLEKFAENQPITQVIATVRALMLGLPVGNHAVWAVIWSLAILIFAVPVASYLFRHKTSN